MLGHVLFFEHVDDIVILCFQILVHGVEGALGLAIELSVLGFFFRIALDCALLHSFDGGLPFILDLPLSIYVAGICASYILALE